MRRIGVLLAAIAALGIMVSSVWGTAFIHPTAVDHPFRALLCLGLVALFLGLPLTAGVRRWFSWIIFESRAKRFEWCLFVIAVTWYSLLSFELFQGIPHLDDAIASLFQARVFLDGHLTLPLPDHGEFFRQFGVLSESYGSKHWVGMYPPGWPALLALGDAAGAAWIVNPILGALLVVFTGRLGRDLFSRDVGRMAALLCLFSPFLGIMHATHLSHTATALGCVLGWWAGLKMVQGGRIRWGIVAGLALGTAFLCRPLTAMLLGGCLGVGLLFYFPPAWFFRAWKAILAAVVMVCMAAGVQLAFQKVSTGDAFTPGHEIGMGRRGKMGFVKLDHARTHTVEIGVDYSGRRLVALNQTLNGWPIPALLLALVPLVIGARPWKAFWLLTPLIGLILAFATFWYWEEYYPGRYVVEAMPFILVLSAAGWARLRDVWQGSHLSLRLIPGTWVVGGILFALSCSNHDLYKYYTPQHGDVENILPQVVKKYGIKNALVLMDSIETRFHWDGDQYNNYYATGFHLNDLEFSNDVVYAWNEPPDKAQDRGHLRDRRALLFKAYEGRNFFLYRFDRGADRAWLYTFNVVNGVPTARIPVVPQDACKLLMYTGVAPKDSL